MYKYISISALSLLLVSFLKKETSFTFNTVEHHLVASRHSIDSTLLAPFSNSELTSFYRINDFKTVWNSSGHRKLVSTILSKADEEGLNPEDYQGATLSEIESRFANLNDSELVNYDILMTLSVQKYISRLNSGKLNPKTLYDDWDLKLPSFDINKNLTEAIKGDSLNNIFENIKPKHLVYRRLKAALSILNSLPKDTLNEIVFANKLKLNTSDIGVPNLKKRLMYWKDLKPRDSLTKIYDEETFKAVKKFQKRHGLASDGVIGKATILALNTTKEERKKQIIANLERWRWYPKNLSSQYLIVNIPDFKLHAICFNDTVRTHNVIVGTSKRKTPILNSKLSYAVFNPTWTVPPTILKEDIIPETIKNRSYLRKKNIKIYDYSNNEISIWKWNPDKAMNYKYVQSPGTYNSLGMVKILFPNDFTVYLHDTNHRELFGKTDRSLSSGCVRVQNPMELTEYLLDDGKNWNLEKITETLKSEKTQSVKFKSDIYIYQFYWTAWSDKNTLQFRPDIYDLDNELYCLLRN